MHFNRQSGFTLIETLVVIAVIGLLVALILPAVQAAREAARRVQCVNNLKQLGIALRGHVDSFGTYPSGSGTRYGNGSYLVPLLPFIEQRVAYDAINFTDTSVSSLLNNSNATVEVMDVSCFVCPSEPKSSEPIKRTNYAGNAGFPDARAVSY